MNTASSAIRLGMLISVSVFSLGCTSGPPTIQTGDDAEVTFDGLHKVDNAQADEAWARPDFDISTYTKIMPVRTTVQYTPAKNMGRSPTERELGGPYFISDESKARFEALVSKTFGEELQQIKHFTFTDKAGPDVLIVSGGLIDVSSYVPPQSVNPGSGIYIRRVGEATLVLELRDSETGTALARSVDRRAAQNMGGNMQESSPSANSAEVYRLIQFWAGRLRDGLDGFVEESENEGT
jgi:hypothetical protein